MTIFPEEVEDPLRYATYEQWRRDGTHCSICGRGFLHGEWIYGAGTVELETLCVNCAVDIDPTMLCGLKINEPYVFRGD